MNIAVPPITIPEFYTPIATDATPANVDKSPAQVGTLLVNARADHKHNIATASAVGLTANTTNTEGTSTSLARADHTHNIPTDVPVTIGTSNTAGTSTSFARADHVHNHGNQAGGSLHAVATGSTAGFMAAADKTKLDSLTQVAVAGSDTQVQYNSAGNLAASANLTWNNSTSTLSTTNMTVTSGAIGSGNATFYLVPKRLVSSKVTGSTGPITLGSVTAGASDTVYLITCEIDLSSYTSGSMTVSADWTPAGKGTAITGLTNPGTLYTGTGTSFGSVTSINALSTFNMYPVQLVVKAGTTMTFYTTGTFVMTYSSWITISQVTL